MAELTTVTHWQRPDRLKVKPNPGWGRKWVRKGDLEMRLAEGWRVVEKEVHMNPIHAPLDRASKYKGLVLMEAPQSFIDERNAYWRERHNRKLRAMVQGTRLRDKTDKAVTSEVKDSNELAGVIGKGLSLRQGVVTEDGLVHTDNKEIPLDAHPDDIAKDEEELHELREKTDERGQEPQDEAPAPKQKLKKKRR